MGRGGAAMGGAPRGAVDPRLQRQRRFVGGRGGDGRGGTGLDGRGAAGRRGRSGGAAMEVGEGCGPAGRPATPDGVGGGGTGWCGRGDVEEAARVRWRSGRHREGCVAAGRPATADGVGGSGVVVGGEGTRAREMGTEDGGGWREETEDGGGTAVNVPASLPSANGRQTFFAVRQRTAKRWAWVGYTITGPTNLFAVR
nr:PE-PGRS family protein PE_PGRS26-like [Aegilops tauschii subsp. strangulata]